MSLSPAAKRIETTVAKELAIVTDRALTQLLQRRHPDGYWWYTLEANDSINAEAIFLYTILGIDDKATIQGICSWLLKNQNQNGSFSLYFGDPGDLSATVECYLALKLAGFKPNHPALQRARNFILQHGGLTHVRVFTRIHLALFGLVSWKICPHMPVTLIQFPPWTPVNIYEFSSWARVSIVPLLIIMDQHKSKHIDGLTLDELYVEKNPREARFVNPKDARFLSVENLFLQADRVLKIMKEMKIKPMHAQSLKKCENYIRSHFATTIDIFPALFYGALALNALGFDFRDESIQKALKGLRSFQINAVEDLPQVPFRKEEEGDAIYQQCCVSPVWDTAWAAVTALRAGLPPGDKRMLHTANWLLQRQITDIVGDWGIKNAQAEPGGWSFEFDNKNFPDVDDTIEVLTFLHAVDLPYRVLSGPIRQGLNWLLSMQCKNGGFAAFDKDNDFELLNRLPFADHGACLDPATADITGRVIEFLIGVCDFKKDDTVIGRAANFIVRQQKKDGSFWGRWGVNHIYGTWCALAGLGVLRRKRDSLVIAKAISWLKSIQNADGGFGEACASYREEGFVPLGSSTPSQTAWALLGLIAGHQTHSPEARLAVKYLLKTATPEGSWPESHFTGTGFPGHFYIRYHGYAQYFPLLALAEYRNVLQGG